jgi:TRAP-type C4-dicarboxylate transport system substrate-binding protein
MWMQLRDPIRRTCAFALIILCVTWSCLLAAAPARAQQQTIRVLIDESFGLAGQRFIDQLFQNLPEQARENVRLERVVFPPPEIEAHLQDLAWDMAILSTGTLVDTNIKTTAIAFEMPFLFSNMTAVRNLQHSSVGRAALSTMSKQGITGLVYLNAGVTLLANRIDVKSPNELVGKKVAVYSASLATQLKQIGATPLVSRPAEARDALGKGVIDSVAINSTNPTSWAGVLLSGGSF